MSKIIFVPSENNSGAKTHFVEGNVTFSVGGVECIGKPSLYVKIDPPKPASPFFEALNFLGGREVMDISDLQISLRVWERADMIDWIEANCQRAVVVQAQRTIHEDSWRLGFASSTDYYRFNAWFFHGKNHGCFEFDIPETTYNEILAWVKDNVKGEAEVKRVGYGRQIGRVRMAVKIKEVLEIVAFKLRWYGEGMEA